MYDPFIKEMLMHTWKDTYLFFDGYTYKEYGAIQITEEKYLSYRNSQFIKDAIADDLIQTNTVLLEYSYFIRKNGIMHIQCNVHSSSGEILYGYYTIKYIDNKLDRSIGNYVSGQMEPSFSNLEVMY